MTKTAIVYNRESAFGLIPNHSQVLISISGTRTKYDKQILLSGWKDALALVFDDFVEPEHGIPGIILFDTTHAKQILDFVTTHSQSDFIIHCDAGVSRSVAVGAFLRDFFGYTLHLTQVPDDRHRNIRVYNFLRRLHLNILDS